MKQKYTGYRYVYTISPSDTEWFHIVTIDVYLYKDEVYITKEQYKFDHKFPRYMPFLEDIESLKLVVKTYIHNLLTQKYKNIMLLPPKEHRYIWDIKVNKS